jgi:hypothetical protein
MMACVASAPYDPRSRPIGVFDSGGDAEAFHELGTRFLQMPLGAVERVELAEVGAPA